MSNLPPHGQTSQFRDPTSTLPPLDPGAVARVITAAADIALVLDTTGVIQDLSVSTNALSAHDCEHWHGLPWTDTVAVDSRAKVEQLLGDAHGSAPVRSREINHRKADGSSVPVRYTTVGLQGGGTILAIGHDLQVIAALQQQLVRAQQSMEREYARLRHSETRYRLLFQISSESVLIADAVSRRIIDANPAAADAIGLPINKLVGRDLEDLFEPPDREPMRQMLAEVRYTGRATPVAGTLAAATKTRIVAASLFRHENTSQFLIRLMPPAEEQGPGSMPETERSPVLDIVAGLPDSFVVTDPDRQILTANQAFLDLIQAASEHQIRGEPLDRWIGRTGVDFNVLIANLREYGSIRNFGTIVRGEYGTTEEIDLSAVAALDGEEPCYGFVLRPLTRRTPVEPEAGHGLPQSVEQLTELVGRVPMREIVRDTTEIIERLCVEAALRKTGDNRASASQLLGLSRQSLYAKLRRYGLGDDSDDSE